MNQHNLNLTALHTFLDASRTYLNLSTASKQRPAMERRSPTRMIAASVSALREFQKTGSRENAPA